MILLNDVEGRLLYVKGCSRIDSIVLGQQAVYSISMEVREAIRPNAFLKLPETHDSIDILRDRIGP